MDRAGEDFSIQTKTFKELSTSELHQILRERQNVFIIEQNSVYEDIDELDFVSIHIIAVEEASGNFAGYARLEPPMSRYPDPSFGRVLSVPQFRKRGVGKKLVAACLKISQENYPEMDLRISAQVYLIPFYEQFGFRVMGDSYDDAGIEHIDMIKKVPDTFSH